MRGLILLNAVLVCGCYGSHGLTGSPDGSTGPDGGPDASDAPYDPVGEPTDAVADDPPTLCGNGTLDPGEECDDGNDVGSDDCTNACRRARCGDGVRWDGHEECDGSDLGGATCASLDPAYEGGVLRCSECTYDTSGCIARCGNGALDPGEECDDGNDVMWDGCGECAVVEVQVNVAVDGDQMYPDVAMGDDGFVIVWQSETDGIFDIVGRRFGATGSAVGPELRVSQFPARDQIHPAIAMNGDGEFIVVWQSLEQDGDGWGIYARRFRSDGSPRGGEFRVNEYATDDQTKASVGMAADGGHVIAWESHEQDGSDQGVFARIFAADGTAVGDEFLVNEHTRYSQSDCSVAVAPDGRFVIAWESFMQDGAGEGIYAKAFAADSWVERHEFQANTWVTRNQATPSVAMEPDGSFVIVWKSEGQDGDGWGVFGREFGTIGTLDGEEFQANSVTRNNQTHPLVALAPGGRRVVAWSSMLTDGSGYGVYGRRLASEGTPSGAEFHPNTFTTDDQWVSALAMRPDGSFIVVWSSYEMDGSGAGIFSQRYSPSGSALGAAAW